MTIRYYLHQFVYKIEVSIIVDSSFEGDCFGRIHAWLIFDLLNFQIVAAKGPPRFSPRSNSSFRKRFGSDNPFHSVNLTFGGV